MQNLTAEAQMTQRNPNQITEQILGAAFEVHSILGPGLLEVAYEKALQHELTLRGLSVCSQIDIPVRYKGQDLGVGFRLDILVENTIIVEIKSVDKMSPVHTAQLLTYLKLKNLNLGLLLNFNSASMREGVKRVVNEFVDSASSAPLR